MWKKLLKMELRKVITSKFFWLSLFIGLCLAGIQAYNNIGYIRWVDEGSRSMPHPYGFDSTSLLILWLGVDNRTTLGTLFYLAFPVLAAMPFGASYFTERKNGYALQIITKSGQKSYLSAKWTAAFLSGMLVIGIPMIFNLMLNALICPLGEVHILSFVAGVRQGYIASKLFYTHPVLYILIGLALNIVWGGICAVISLTAGMFLKNRILVVISPSILLELIGFVLVEMKILFHFTKYTVIPREMMMTVGLDPKPTWYVISYLCVAVIATWCIYWKRGRKRESI